MATTAMLDIKDGRLLTTLRAFFRSVLELEEISAILVPMRPPMRSMVMPTLVTDPEALADADPLSPAFPMNGAKVASKLSRKPSGGRMAAVLRPCEIRAFVELVKLKQARTDDLVIIAADCLGAYRNTDFVKFAGDDPEAATNRFSESVLSGKGAALDGVDLAPACKACEHPIPDGADIAIGLIGVASGHEILGPLPVTARSEAGEAILKQLKLPDGAMPEARKASVNALVAERTAFRDQLLADTHAATDSLEKLGAYLANCVNCYNCRVACPVCYCKECVFLTDVFNHEPSQYLQWARRKGAIKMPTDTVFYHMTRLAHMSTACVGCGQCSNACPNEIPVMELFRSVARKTQAAFDYEAGRDVDEVPPLSVFKEDEFQEVVGIN